MPPGNNCLAVCTSYCHKIKFSFVFIMQQDEKLGIPTADIFMDHAGFSTYNSMYRAKKIFQVDTAVIVTQAYHLPRAVYTARSLGITAVGIEADKHIYAGAGYYSLRETPARIKAFWEVNSHAKPVFLGEVIPVSGDGRATHDGN